MNMILEINKDRYGVFCNADDSNGLNYKPYIND